MHRRNLLKLSLIPLVTALRPGSVIAAYPKDAFLAREVPAALQEVFGTADIAESDQIEIDAPHIAKDPEIVPIRVRSTLPDTQSISILVQTNKSPLASHFRLYEAPAVVSTRIRLAEDGEVLAVVKAGGKLYTNTRPVRAARVCRASRWAKR